MTKMNIEPSSRIAATADKPEGVDDQGQNEARPDSNTQPKLREIGGPKGPEPTRYGDWEKKGRCIDF